MYDFKLLNGEKVVCIFDEIFVKQNNNEKITSLVVTNKRLLFLDYIVPNEGAEVLRISRGVNYIKYKEVYYQIALKELDKITKDDDGLYKLVFKNKMMFETNNSELYSLLKGNVKKV